MNIIQYKIVIKFNAKKNMIVTSFNKMGSNIDWVLILIPLGI